jgi:hypothetical protein
MVRAHALARGVSDATTIAGHRVDPGQHGSSTLTSLSSATAEWLCTQYRHSNSAEVRKITSSLVRAGIADGESTQAMKGIATSSASGTCASEVTIGLVPVAP